MAWKKIFKSREEANEIVAPNTMKLLIIGSVRICLMNFQGQYYAIDDRCPHKGASLSKGKSNYLGEVICPLHEYRFRPTTGAEVNSLCHDVRTYPTKLEENGLSIFMSTLNNDSCK